MSYTKLEEKIKIKKKYGIVYTFYMNALTKVGNINGMVYK